MGGNNTSRYNWKLNADNRANDWYFESIADASATPASAATPSSQTPVRRRGADADDPDARLDREGRAE